MADPKEVTVTVDVKNMDEVKAILLQTYVFAKKFIDKVESWKAHSKETYSDMKILVDMIDSIGKPQNERTLEEIMDHAVKYLCDNHHPHTKIIVECDWYEVVEWLKSGKITKHIRD